MEMIPFTESLKNTYERVIPFYEKEIKKYIKDKKNILISAHGNSLRALCKYLFKISDQKINDLEIPTGNPLLLSLTMIKKSRSSTILIGQELKLFLLINNFKIR